MSLQSSRFVWMTIVGVLLLGLLVAGGFVVHRLGWSQGFAASAAEAEGADVPVPPMAPSGWRPLGFRLDGVLLLAVVLGFLLIAMTGKLLRLFVWGLMGAPILHRFAGEPWPHAERS